MIIYDSFFSKFCQFCFLRFSALDLKLVLRLGLRVSLGISVIIRDRVRVRHVRLGISVGVEKAYVSNLLPIEVKSHFYSYH